MAARARERRRARCCDGATTSSRRGCTRCAGQDERGFRCRSHANVRQLQGPGDRPGDCSARCEANSVRQYPPESQAPADPGAFSPKSCHRPSLLAGGPQPEAQVAVDDRSFPNRLARSVARSTRYASPKHAFPSAWHSAGGGASFRLGSEQVLQCAQIGLHVSSQDRRHQRLGEAEQARRLHLG